MNRAQDQSAKSVALIDLRENKSSPTRTSQQTRNANSPATISTQKGPTNRPIDFKSFADNSLGN